MLGARERKDGRKRDLYCPQAIAVTPVGSPLLLEYEDLRLRESRPWEAGKGEVIGTYPWAGIVKMTVREYTEHEARLLVEYEQAAQEFAYAGRLPDAFVTAYRAISHPIFFRFWPYFAPEFARAVLQPGDRA